VTTVAWTGTVWPSMTASPGGGPASSPAGTGSETRATVATGTAAGLEMVNRTSPARAANGEMASASKMSIRLSE